MSELDTQLGEESTYKPSVSHKSAPTSDLGVGRLRKPSCLIGLLCYLKFLSSTFPVQILDLGLLLLWK